MSYKRVIPRDLFNEAKLLKCMGLLSLKIHDWKVPEGITIEINENWQQFVIEKDESSGDIYISNYETKVNGKKVRFETNLNSTAPFPLTCMYNDTSIQVFTDSGEFDQEFISAFTS